MAVVNELGKRLKELRGDKPLNQVSLESGIDRGQLRRYEEGRVPEDNLLEKLANHYQVSYDELKALSFETIYPPGSKQRRALFNWVERSKA